MGEDASVGHGDEVAQVPRLDTLRRSAVGLDGRIDPCPACFIPVTRIALAALASDASLPSNG